MNATRNTVPGKLALVARVSLLFLAIDTGWTLADDVDLTAVDGTVIAAGFNATQVVDLTVGAEDLSVTSMTLPRFDIRGPVGTEMLVGARIYRNADRELIASSDAIVPRGDDRSLTVAISATLSAGEDYRVGFVILPHVGFGNGQGDLFDPDPRFTGGFPYEVGDGLLTVKGGFTSDLREDVYPEHALFVVPRVSMEVSVARPTPNLGRVLWPRSEGGNDHEYQAVIAPGGITWHEARQAAEEAGGHLVTIRSDAENLFVFELIDFEEFWSTFPEGACCSWGPWLGGFQEEGADEPVGGWRWVTDEPFEYDNWRDGEPNESGVEDHLQFFDVPVNTRSPLWNDANGDLLMPGYVIEFGTDEPPPPPRLELGDVNRDGVLDEEDFSALKRLIGVPEVSEQDLETGDLDADGVLTDDDAALLRQRLGLDRFQRGDCNGDLGIDLSDPIFLIRDLFLGGESPSCPDACDTNDDGRLDTSDIIYSLSFQFRGGPQPPPPFEACGLDPTPDALGICVAPFFTCLVTASDVLGEGFIEAVGSHNEAFDTTLVLYRHQDTHKVTFRMVAPSRYFDASVDGYRVRGYARPGCEGEPVCEASESVRQTVFDRAGTNENGTFFDPHSHDDCVLEELRRECGCEREDVRSIEIIVSVVLLGIVDDEIRLDFVDFRFCLECDEIEV